jgi:hypothetical protein
VSKQPSQTEFVRAQSSAADDGGIDAIRNDVPSGLVPLGRKMTR